MSFFLIGLAVSVAVLGGAEYVHAQTVSVDRQTYTAGQTVTIRGSGLGSGIATIQILDSAVTLKHIEIEGIGPDGSISAQIKTDETTWQAGRHTVKVFVGSAGPYETTFELIQTNIPPPAPGPAPVDPTRTVSGFPDPNRGSQYYLDRYANEPAYREWFHSQFPNFTIYEVLGILPPAPDVQTNTRLVIAPVSNTTVSSILEAYVSRGLVVFTGILLDSGNTNYTISKDITHTGSESGTASISVIRPDIHNTVPGLARGHAARGQTAAGFLYAGIMINATDAGSPGIVNYALSDDAGQNGNATLSVFVREIGNVPPVLSPVGDYSINARETLAFRVSAVDFGGDMITYRLSGAPHGATMSRQGDFSWTPGSTDVANHTFTIIAYDVHGAADAESVTITVLPAGTANQPPTAPNATATVARGGLVTIIPAITDPDGDRVSIVDVGGGAGGSAISSADSIEYLAATNAAAETVTYTVLDSRGACHTGTITVDIQGAQIPGLADAPVQANAAPLLGAISSMDIDVQDALEFTAVACDRNGDTLTYSLAGQPAGATINSTNGEFIWRPVAMQRGSHTFTIITTDGHGGNDTESVTVRVLPTEAPNQPPTAPGVSAAMARDDLITIIPAIYDPDGDRVRIVGATGNAGGTILSSNDRIYYHTTVGRTPESITYTAADARGGIDIGKISVYISKYATWFTFNDLSSTVVYPGDTLTLSGTAKRDSNITAIITAPRGDVVKENLIEIESGGRWSEEYTVPDNADLGTYEAKIADKHGSIGKGFSVKSPDTIHLAPARLYFEPGKFIIFNGIAAPNRPLEWILEDPRGWDIHSERLEVGPDGQVSILYRTALSDTRGTYKLSATQGEHAKVSSAVLGHNAPISVVMDKFNYNPGDNATIMIEGPQFYSIPLMVISQTGQNMFARPELSTADSLSRMINTGVEARAEYVLDLTDYREGIYTASLSSGSAHARVEFGVGLKNDTNFIDLIIAKPEYMRSDAMVIHGSTLQSLPHGDIKAGPDGHVLLTIYVVDPAGNTIRQIDTFSDSSGRFVESIRIPADAEYGRWTVSVRSDKGLPAECQQFSTRCDVILKDTTFNVIPDPDERKMEIIVEDVREYAGEEFVSIRVVLAGPDPDSRSSGLRVSIVSPSGEELESIEPYGSGGQAYIPWPILPEFTPGQYTIIATNIYGNATATFELSRSE